MVCVKEKCYKKKALFPPCGSARDFVTVPSQGLLSCFRDTGRHGMLFLYTELAHGQTRRLVSQPIVVWNNQLITNSHLHQATSCREKKISGWRKGETGAMFMFLELWSIWTQFISWRSPFFKIALCLRAVVGWYSSTQLKLCSSGSISLRQNRREK